MNLGDGSAIARSIDQFTHNLLDFFANGVEYGRQVSGVRGVTPDHGAGSGGRACPDKTCVTCGERQAYYPALNDSSGGREKHVGGVRMKSIHEVVQKELELQQMLNDAIREKELGLRELQKVLLNALYLVNRLLDEMPTDTGGNLEMSSKPLQSGTIDAEKPTLVGKAIGISHSTVGTIEQTNMAVSASKPRDLP